MFVCNLHSSKVKQICVPVVEEDYDADILTEMVFKVVTSHQLLIDRRECP